jgi:hypothetical protein
MATATVSTKSEPMLNWNRCRKATATPDQSNIKSTAAPTVATHVNTA